MFVCLSNFENGGLGQCCIHTGLQRCGIHLFLKIHCHDTNKIKVECHAADMKRVGLMQFRGMK